MRRDESFQAFPGPRQSTVRHMTLDDLTKFLNSPMLSQELIVRIVNVDGSRVLLETVKCPGHAATTIWVNAADVTDFGPADDLRMMCPMRWRAEFSNCRRVRIPFAAWSEHLYPTPQPTSCQAGLPVPLAEYENVNDALKRKELA